MINVTRKWIAQYVVSSKHEKVIGKLMNVAYGNYKTTLTLSKKARVEAGDGLEFDVYIPRFGWCSVRSWKNIVSQSPSNLNHIISERK